MSPVTVSAHDLQSLAALCLQLIGRHSLVSGEIFAAKWMEFKPVCFASFASFP